MRFLLVSAAALTLAACATSPLGDVKSTKLDASDIAFAGRVAAGNDLPEGWILDEDGIKGRVVGKDVTMAAIGGDTQYRVRFNADGSAFRKEIGALFGNDKGSWNIAEGKLCVTFGTETCYTVYNARIATLVNAGDSWFVVGNATEIAATN